MKRFPFVKQTESMLCGAACLAAVCRFYGKRYTVGTLSQFCKTTTQGISLLGLSRAAAELGFDCMSVRITRERLADCPLPCILHWNQNHFVVLYRIDTRRGLYYVCDPAKGRVRYTAADFADLWLSCDTPEGPAGIALLLEPDERFGCVPESRETRKRSVRMLRSYVFKYRKYFALVTLSLLLASALQLIMPFLTQAIVDHGIRLRSVRLIWLIVLGEFFIVCGRTATSFVRRWLLLHISMRINITILSDFFIKLLRLPMAFFEARRMGDLMQRMRDHERIEAFLTTQVLNVLFNVLSFLVFAAVLLVYNAAVFGIFMAGSVVYAAWIAAFMGRRKTIDYERFEQEADDQNKTFQFLTALQEIKLQRCERRRRWEWEDVQARLFAVRMKSLRLQQTQEAGSVFINELKNILITVFAATAVINGHMTIGAMLAVQYMIGQLSAPVDQFLAFTYALQDVGIALERINEIHHRPDEDADGRLASFPDADGRDLCLADVEFKYDPYSPHNIIDKVSLRIPRGKVTAIVGASGSGKTTLVKLMLGFYPLEAGRITIAGTDIAAYDMRWWRSCCGVVMQDGVIFSESIARNIAVDDDDIDTTRMEQAARIGCIHDYITSLPMKYNTVIGRDGTGLSQGQKQRILIARAVYKNPEYIFLDEATNSLDATNERAIVDNLAQFYRGRTAVVVAHRLSTVRDADNIVVLDHGRVAETGTHSSLTARRGIYYNLVKNQLELGN